MRIADALRTTVENRGASLALVGVLSLGALSVTACGSGEATAQLPQQKIGNDVSFPQCEAVLPEAQSFGVVGVNGSLASKPNPCFAKELKWAQQSRGDTAQPKVSVYVLSANPGDQGVTSWPKSGQNRHGSCVGTDSAACAFEYGQNLAEADVNIVAPAKPTEFKWWIDVQVQSSWETNQAHNAAVLEGMVTYLHSKKADVGIYSGTSHWDRIAGSVQPSSELNGLDNWLFGATNVTEAIHNCAAQSLTGGVVKMAQYTTPGVDADISCR